MAAPARAKIKPSISKAGKDAPRISVQAGATKVPLEIVYEELVELMMRHAPQFRTDIACMSGGKRSFQLTVPKKVAVPGAYGGKPVDLQMAAAILQKGYVGFYLMCIYMNDG